MLNKFYKDHPGAVQHINIHLPFRPIENFTNYTPRPGDKPLFH